MIARLRAACTIVAAGVVLAARLAAATPGAAALPHLRGIEEIREWFNANTGHVRLILLLSPT